MPDTLTQDTLGKIYSELEKASMPLVYDERGRPCYSLWFEGTEEEYRILKQKLIELEP